MRVIAIDGGDDKRDLCKRLGAEEFIDFTKDPTVVAGAPPLLLCLKKLNIVGSVVGTLKDVEEALDFTARGLVRVSC